MYFAAICSSFTPSETPHFRSSFTPLNCHASILHIASPFSCATETGDMLTELIDLRSLLAPMAWSNAALRRQHSRVVNNETEELPNQSPHFPSLMDFLILWKAYSSPKRITSGLPSPGSNRDHFPYADFQLPIRPSFPETR